MSSPTISIQVVITAGSSLTPAPFAVTERTNLRSAELDGSFNAASGSPNLGTDAKCIPDCFCQ